jgi:DNA-binding SARP family transcriptional activator
MDTTSPNSVLFLAWLDSTGSQDVKTIAIVDGERVTPESALARLFPDGPEPGDIARLDAEFRRVALEAGGVGITTFFDSVSQRQGVRDDIEINVLSGTASRGGREIALSDGEFAIASVIALNRPSSTREELCDQLWPERDPESSSRLLKVYVHRIRGKFGTNRVIDSHGGGYSLGRDVRVDVHALDALARAQNVRATPLAALELSEVERAFTGVAERRYRRIACVEAYADLERRLIATGIELGRLLVHDALLRDDPARAVNIAENLATLDPYDDVAAELLIRAQLGLGRHDAASRFFRTFCRTLHDELALPPPAHLARLLA